MYTSHVALYDATYSSPTKLILQRRWAGALIHFSDWGGGGGKRKKYFVPQNGKLCMFSSIFMLNLMVF